MPLTPLLPANDSPITINQGNTGDCYLLASLDCILKSGPEGRQTLKNLFTETEKGIEVRINYNAQSKFLYLEALKEKYGYREDNENHQHVIFIDRERLEEIDNTPGGVQSNALAVKILEHLIPYFFIAKWDHTQPQASFSAHSGKNRFGTLSEARFVADILNIQTEDYLINQLDDIIKLKDINASQPVYLAMAYGEIDTFGKTHGGHALRLNKIMANKKEPNRTTFFLINPWHNQEKPEIYTLDEIKQRNAHFSIFNPESSCKDIRSILATLANLRGKPVVVNTKLFDTLLTIKKVNSSLSVPLVEGFLDFNDKFEKNNDFFLIIFNSLEVSKQKNLLSFILSPHQKELTQFLAEHLPLEKLEEYLKNPEQLHILLEIKELSGFFNLRGLEKWLNMKEEVTFLPEIFNLLNIEDKKKLAVCLSSNEEPLEYFKSLLASNPTANEVFFERVFQETFIDKAAKTNFAAARTELKIALIEYYHKGELKCLEGFNPLHHYFATEVLDKSTIDKKYKIHAEGPKAKELIANTLENIANFPLPFSQTKSLAELNKHKELLVEDLERISTDPKIKSARELLGFAEYSLKIETALNEKIQQIEAAAQSQVSKIKGSELIVNDRLAKIRRIGVSFDNLGSKEAMEEHEHFLQKTLQKIFADPDLKAALATLGSATQKGVETAYTNKRNEITTAAQEHKATQERKSPSRVQLTKLQQFTLDRKVGKESARELTIFDATKPESNTDLAANTKKLKEELYELKTSQAGLDNDLNKSGFKNC
ncbi:hypothetical protein [Legionella sainthelensi]|uniref:hypothetical protein n=1 Tax=Legionella sainthelensi TaxID=28087 RepID=UPI000E20B4A6|nr:hypothetical protein [Legionella sainthelensi]